MLIPTCWEIEDGVEAAPELVREGLASALGSGMQSLSAGLKVKAGLSDITVDSTPYFSLVQNGHLGLYSQVFVSQMTSPISKGNYSRAQKRFNTYKLSNGRRFRTSELARPVKNDKIVTPGFHEVKGKYMRSNPDDTTDNNLLERFGWG